MSKFVHVDFPATHAGVDRIENAVSFIKTRSLRLNSSRSLATMLVAALVAALLVVANQVIDTITDGHLFAAWVGLWAIGFAGLAFLAEPVRRLAIRLRTYAANLSQAHRLAVQDEKLWNSALHDAHVMADIRSAMARG